MVYYSQLYSVRYLAVTEPVYWGKLNYKFCFCCWCCLPMSCCHYNSVYQNYTHYIYIYIPTAELLCYCTWMLLLLLIWVQKLLTVMCLVSIILHIIYWMYLHSTYVCSGTYKNMISIYWWFLIKFHFFCIVYHIYKKNLLL